MGIQHYYLFACTARVSERERLAEEARQHADVVEVITLMTGRKNIIVLAAATQKDDVSDLDERGLDIEDEHLIRRHHRQPLGRLHLEENL